MDFRGRVQVLGLGVVDDHLGIPALAHHGGMLVGLDGQAIDDRGIAMEDKILALCADRNLLEICQRCLPRQSLKTVVGDTVH